MKYNIGICDDEKGACAELENIILDYFKTTIDCIETFVWDTGDCCCKDINNGLNLDILFLGIELPGKNGVETGKYIREKMKNNVVEIVYISSKTNYAMQLFQVHPYDFLVKPVLEGKIRELLEELIILDKEKQWQYSYRTNSSVHNILFGDIQYFRSNNKHVEIHLTNGTVQVFRGKLKEELPKLSNQFIRIGQSYIINMKYLKECYYDHIVMTNNNIMNISQRYRIDFKQKLLDFNNSCGITNG